ncbi:PREDICTED: 30S ribosomal protein S16-1, chloroplastic-like isoform X1 [Lupinus angustifolius]|uniref:30S ribosomal protein S16-1, chloroplastic-like isoform X1 n=1 Tax=Lupinus angustifolius TaxID=3871 RepID=UPI00092EE2C7|nr:PREDICTED: 30S ribosomal protein S16-1, chloroplastic-like isoform X1 [Lupinus angustifolius]
MTVRIRLARFGRTHRPFYRVVVTDSRTTRDGKNLEILGFYNPLAGRDDEKGMALKLERVKYWLSVGAQPSETVESLLARAGLVPDDATLDQEQPANASQNDDNGVSPEAIFSIGLQVN